MREAHFFNKDTGIFQFSTFEILTKRFTNNAVSFEQPGPDFLSDIKKDTLFWAKSD